MQLKPCARPPIPCLQYACHHAAKPDLAEHIPAFTHGPSGHATLQMCRACNPACMWPATSADALRRHKAALHSRMVWPPSAHKAASLDIQRQLRICPQPRTAFTAQVAMLKHQIHPPAMAVQSICTLPRGVVRVAIRASAQSRSHVPAPRPTHPHRAQAAPPVKRFKKRTS